MDNFWFEAGVGIAALTWAAKTLREIIMALLDKNKGGNATSDMFKILRNIDSNCDELLTMHKVLDKNGVPVWYTNHELADTMKELATAITSLSMATNKTNTMMEMFINSQNGK